MQQSEAAAEAAEKAVCDQSAKTGIGEQQVGVGPFGRPGQNDEQNTGDRADQDKKEDGGPVKPKWEAGMPSGTLLRRLEDRGIALLPRRRRPARLDGQR